MEDLKVVPLALKEYSPVLYVIALIQYRSGCRVSEVLEAEWSNFSPRGELFLRGKKKSSSFTVFIPELELVKKLTSVNSYLCFPHVNRSTVHRAYKKFSLFDKLSGHTTHTTTHIFRHNKAQSFNNLNLSDREKADILGHRGIKSQSYYFRKHGNKSK